MNIEITNKKKINIFTNIFKNLTVFGEEFNLRFDSDGFYMQGMDDGHISLFEIKLHSSWFDSYSIEKDNIIIGVKIDILAKIFNIINDQTLTLKIDNDEDILNIYLKGKITQTFCINVIDIDTQLLGVPDSVEWVADFEIKSKLFDDLIKQHGLFGETITVKCTEEKLALQSNCKITGSMATEIQFGDLDEYCIEEDKNLEVTYSMKYVSYMTRFSELSNNVCVNISDTLPMRMLFKLQKDSKPELEEKSGEEDDKNIMAFYLAPKIDDFD